jgi:hypothetical protein
MPRKDLNITAFAIMQQATGETPPEPVDEKKKQLSLTRGKSGLIGAERRKITLTAEKRAEIASAAARARWKAKADA